MKKILIISAIIISSAWLKSGRVFAQWSTNSAINNAICIAGGDQTLPTSISDGNGGVILTWQDRRNGKTDIYAQKINLNGTVQWGINGVAICTASNNKENPVIISDGNGGAIIAWGDRRSGNADIYVQHVDANGIVQWTNDGVVICSAEDQNVSPAITTDGNGGAIVAWYNSNYGNGDIYAQRINSSGAILWAFNGIAVSNASGIQEVPKIISDGSGGAIITWNDNRNINASYYNWDIYAQRISASGIAQWTINGVEICTEMGGQGNGAIVSDGNGGAIITWEDRRTGFLNIDVYAQYVNANGAVQWTTGGVAICTATGEQYAQLSCITSDGSGGAIITWFDGRSGSNNYDIYVQSINANGVVQWTSNGVAVCTAYNYQFSPTLISDNNGGAIIAWTDYRNGNNLYAQRINSNGLAQWTYNGVAISSAANSQRGQAIISDGNGGAILAWQDGRNGNSDIYAQRINFNGSFCTNPVVYLGADIIQCGGTVLLDAGNTGSTYAWSNGAVGQTLNTSTSGTYSVNVTNLSGCSTSDQINITINPLPLVDLGTDITQCGGSVLLDAENTGATYLWSNGAAGQTLNTSTSGTYSVNVTNVSGCSATDLINVTINPMPISNAGSDQTTYYGYAPLECTTLGVVATGDTYLWTNGSTSSTTNVCPVITSDYTLTVTNQYGCSNSDDATITVVNVVSSNGNTVVMCHNGNNTMNVAPNAVQIHLNHGDYLGACLPAGRTATPPSTKESDMISDNVLIYPNPATNEITVKNTVGEVKITLLNCIGQEIKSTNSISNQEVEINLKDLPNGIYFIKITNEKVNLIKKVVKQ
ncbi:MAG: hypothetical protein A3F72_16110 [Bacteroidetes bacterium RIFCSPLOWO2_12_FULL_35_15]|nr:MAG: hypothetical protein A3F72_16110 [Bacteroidetes bacterium RIFCSPLOWO2_12_FULL_35_15]